MILGLKQDSDVIVHVASNLGWSPAAVGVLEWRDKGGTEDRGLCSQGSLLTGSVVCSEVDYILYFSSLKIVICK
jgi:hypothetical protein